MIGKTDLWLSQSFTVLGEKENYSNFGSKLGKEDWTLEKEIDKRRFKIDGLIKQPTKNKSSSSEATSNEGLVIAG